MIGTRKFVVILTMHVIFVYSLQFKKKKKIKTKIHSKSVPPIPPDLLAIISF